MQQLYIRVSDSSLGQGHINQGGVVGQGLQRHTCCRERFGGTVKLIAENSQHNQRNAPCFLNSLSGLDGAAAGGDQVLDYNDLLSRRDQALDLVLLAVAFGLVADVSHRQVQLVCYPGRMRDTRSSCARNNFSIRVGAGDCLDEGVGDVAPDFREGQCQAVITVDGGFNAGGPGKRVLRAQGYRTDLQQVTGNLFTFIQ
ncbi:hypothetical protein D3C73_963340 [compost metagenome]